MRQNLEPLTNLKLLETLNLRNLPAKRNAEITRLSARYKHQSLAVEVAEEFRKRCPEKSFPKLKTITTGSISYKDMWPGRSSEADGSSGLYLCPRFFHVRWPTNTDNRRTPILTLVAEGTPADAQENSCNLHIFEPYWLCWYGRTSDYE